MITISKFPEEIESYEELLTEAKTSMFGSEPTEMKELVEKMSFKTNKTTFFFGRGKMLGTKILALYAMDESKETYVVSIDLFYEPIFSDRDFNEILNHSVTILDSISIQSP